jgi:phenylalanyl-tRNA synthetase alpha chain
MNETLSIEAIETRINVLKQDFQQQCQSVAKTVNSKSVDDLRVEFLGRKGQLASVMEQLRHISKEHRPAAGKAINSLRSFLEEQISQLKDSSKSQTIKNIIDQGAMDISLPTSSTHQGALHPVSLMRKTLIDAFHRLGFTIVDGPDIELDFYNFSALNFSEHHPARDMHDTFFVDSKEDTVLRTHTSNIQIHTMRDRTPPLRVVAMGRTFRCDSDMTHTPMFHQIEAFVVDHNISFAHMKGTIDFFLKGIFGADCKTRFRPSYFPFVEPGAEVDMACVRCKGKGCRVCKNSGWLEIGGCGMIHPNVLEAVEVDSERFTGFAFGFGIDRMAMLKYSLPDLRQLFDGDQDFLNQFPTYAWQQTQSTAKGSTFK